MSPVQPVSELVNLGPKSRAVLAAAGITAIAQLRRLGMGAAYVEAKQAGVNVNLNPLRALKQRKDA